MLRTLSAAAIVAGAAGAASASLIGTTISVETDHTGTFGSVVMGSQDWGTTETYTDSFGFTYDVTAGVDLFAAQNEVCFDFSDFGYTDFAGEIGTATIGGLAKGPLPSSVIAYDGNGVVIGVGDATDDSVTVSWSVDDALAASAENPIVYVVWDQVPAPGALALLAPAAAGLLVRRRR